MLPGRSCDGTSANWHRPRLSPFRPFKRLESKPGALEAHTTTVAALTRALENAGIQFIDENGGGPGVRLRNQQRREAE